MGRPGAAYATDRYWPVVAGLVAMFLLAAFVDDGAPARIAQSALGAFVLFATYRAAGITPRRLRIMAIVVVVAGVALAASSFSDDRWVIGISALAIAALVGGGPIVLVRRVFEQTTVTIDEIAAAFAAYVQVGLFFSFVFRAVAVMATEPFFASGTAPSGGDFLYFSIVTITTLGYGDFAPATDLGRSLVMIETLLGQVFLVVLVARVVSQANPTRAAARPDEGGPA